MENRSFKAIAYLFIALVFVVFIFASFATALSLQTGIAMTGSSFLAIPISILLFRMSDLEKEIDSMKDEIETLKQKLTEK